MQISGSSGSALLDNVLLRTFVEVVDSGSLVAAADRLALTPSAVSGHIKRLEQAAGAPLLTRTTRRICLTAPGDTLYTYGRRILLLEQEARAKLVGRRLKGSLKVGASEDFATAWLPEVLKRFRRENPDASIELSVGLTTDLLRKQERGELDVVFGKRCSRVDVGGTLLWEEPLVWVLSEEQRLDVHEPMPLAVLPDPCIYRESAISSLSNAGIATRIVFESTSMSACIAAARSGLAVTVTARSHLGHGMSTTRAADLFPALPSAQFYAFTREDTPESEALADAACKSYRPTYC